MKANKMSILIERKINFATIVHNSTPERNKYYANKHINLVQSKFH